MVVETVEQTESKQVVWKAGMLVVVKVYYQVDKQVYELANKQAAEWAMSMVELMEYKLVDVMGLRKAVELVQ